MWAPVINRFLDSKPQALSDSLGKLLALQHLRLCKTSFSALPDALGTSSGSHIFTKREC